MNPKERKEDDVTVLYPYCHKKFKRSAKPKPHCRSKPNDNEDWKNNEKQFSTDYIDDENDGKVLCPYCHKRFKSLYLYRNISWVKEMGYYIVNTVTSNLGV